MPIWNLQLITNKMWNLIKLTSFPVHYTISLKVIIWRTKRLFVCSYAASGFFSHISWTKRKIGSCVYRVALYVLSTALFEVCANGAVTNGRKWVVDHLVTFHYRPLLLLPRNKIMLSCPSACAEGNGLILRNGLKGIILDLDLKP